jgi:hypothetical protein
MSDCVLDYMRRHKLLTGDRHKDRQTYISLAYCGDIDPNEYPLDGELEAALPKYFQNLTDPIIN